MKLITLGQKVVTTFDYCIEEKEILWGFIIEATPETGEGVIMHAIEVDEEGEGVQSEEEEVQGEQRPVPG